MKKTNLKPVANFLFEMGMLSKTPRSGFFFLGSGKQSVSEHIFRVAMIGYALAKMDKKINTQKILEMCLLHDISEARISDLNYVHQKYTERFEEKAIEDLIEPLPFGDDIKQTLIEYKKKDCKEALLVKDADNLELLLSLKEQLDIGNLRVKTWIPSLLKRLKTKEGEALAKMILSTDYDEWWFSADSKKDVWWIDRKKK